MRASAVALLLRRERSDLGAALLLALLIAFTAFVFSAGVRLFSVAVDEGLRRAVESAPVVQRTIEFTATRSLFEPDSARTVAEWKAEGEEQRATLAEPIRALVDEGNLTVGSVRLGVANPPDFPIFITLRYHHDFEEMVELVSGRWPVSTGDELPPVAEFPNAGSVQPGWPVGMDHSSDATRRFEIAVQEATAEQLGLTIGSPLRVGVDFLDPMLSSTVLRYADIILAPTELEITGLYRVRDPESDAWFGEPGLRFDDLGNTSTDVDRPIAYISAYVPSDAMPGLVTSALPFEYQWRFPILTERLDADAVDEIERGLRSLESAPAGVDASHDLTTDAGLLPLLRQHSALRAASQAVLGLAASAPLALAAGAMAMAAVLINRRRRAAVILARGRGASGRLLLGVGLLEAITVAFLAALAGLALGIALEPAAELEPSLLVALAIGVLAVAVLGGATWPQVRQPLGDLERGARPARPTSPRRLVLELSVVSLALVGAYVLRQRGMVAAAGGFDPFLAAVPPLIALAAAIVIVRLYRPVLAVAGRLADRRRDLVPALGLRTVARGAASSLPALVLILAVAFAAFGSIVSSSIDRGQQVASWSAVGADIRVEPVGTARDLPAGLGADDLPGVEAAAVGFVESGIRAPLGMRTGTIRFQAVDAAAHADVVNGSPIEPTWPSVFLDQPADGPLPAIVSSRITGGDLGLGVGDTFDIPVLGRRLEMQIVEVRPAFDGLATGDSFVVVPYSWLEDALGQDVPVSVMWLRAPAHSVAALRERLGAGAGAIAVVTRYDAHAALRDEPLVGAVGTGFTLAFAVSVAYAALTILGAVVLSVGRRTRDLAVLRTLGLNGREQTRLTLVEHAAPILIALLPGLGLGIGIASAVAPALGLGAFSGSSGDVPLAIDWLALAALSAALASLALATVVIGSWLSGRAAIMNALRITSD